MNKILHIIILLAALTFASAGNDAKAQQIELGGWNIGEWNPIFVPKSALDTIKCLTHIPDGFSVKSFRIAATIDGFDKEATSNSEYFTPKQRGILTSVTVGNKIYVEDIKLINNQTNEESQVGASIFKVVDKPREKSKASYLPLENKFEGWIELGGWNTGEWETDFIPKAALDTITCLTNVPEGFRVRSFKLGAMVDGSYRTATSYSAELTEEQRYIIRHTKLNDCIYIRNIILETKQTKDKATTNSLVIRVVENPKKHVGKRPMTLVYIVGNDDNWIATNIGLGIYNSHNQYVQDNALDTVTHLTNIPDNHRVITFTITGMIKGESYSASSNNAALTIRQREIISKVPAGEKLYINNIKLRNEITGQVISADRISLTKDGMDARCNWGAFDYEDYPKIYAYPSFGSKNDDTTHYVVQSFRIEATNPDYFFLYEIDGNKIDSITFSHLTQHNTSGWQGSHDNFWIRDIRCKEVATGKDVSAPDIKPSNENIFSYVYRSKNYFLNSNSKIDFFYKPNFKIDSVSVIPPSVYANVVPDAISKFNGDVFPKDFKAFVKNMKPFTALVFYIYHDGKEEKVSVMIVE